MKHTKRNSITKPNSGSTHRITVSTHARRRIAQRLGITEHVEDIARLAFKTGIPIPYMPKRSLSNTFRLYRGAVWVFRGANVHCLLTVIPAPPITTPGGL